MGKTTILLFMSRMPLSVPNAARNAANEIPSEVMMADLIWFGAPTDGSKIDQFVHFHGPSFIQNWI